MMQSIGDVFFFDIETVANKSEEIVNILYPMPEKKTAEDAPKNYKKEETILKWVEESYVKDLQKREDSINNGALDIDSAIIRSIAYAVGEGEVVCRIGEERDVLKGFLKDWSAFREESYGGTSCGYNSINYDWSVILRRTAILGLGEYMKYRPNMNRFSGEIDLSAVAYNFGYAAGKNKGMKRLAQILGVAVPAGDMDGSQVADMSDEDLIFYNKSDVFVLREIFNKFNGIYI